MATVPSGPPGAASAVIVPVPEAEPIVARHRARLDPAAAWGVPAHVTVLFPFVPPGALTSTVIEGVAEAAASVSAFDCTFTHTGWFGQEVLWLAPDPADPFRALTHAVHAAFPRYPPYGGAFAGVVPHLTIGDQPGAGSGALREAEAEVTAALPVLTRVTRAWLMAGVQAPGGWRPVAELPLGA